MIRLFSELRALQEEGKLHKSLILRIRILFGISFLFMCAVLYNVIVHGANPWIAVGLAVIGFVTGMFLFSRMNPVLWNEQERVVQAGRMDMAGFGILIFYVAFEFGFRTLINDVFPVEATAFVLAAVFGTILGRAVGTLVEIHRVYRATHQGEKRGQ